VVSVYYGQKRRVKQPPLEERKVVSLRAVKPWAVYRLTQA